MAGMEEVKEKSVSCLFHYSNKKASNTN